LVLDLESLETPGNNSGLAAWKKNAFLLAETQDIGKIFLLTLQVVGGDMKLP